MTTRPTMVSTTLVLPDKPKYEDGRQAAIFEINSIEDDIFYRVQSWDETKQHEFLLKFAGKKVRITLEVVP